MTVKRTGLSLGERWLQFANVPFDTIPHKWALARLRARRYPRPFRWLYPLAVWFVDWFGPLLILYYPLPARWLPDDKFDELFTRLRKHSGAMLRTLGLFVTLPLMEVSAGEKAPAAGYVHPLAKFRLSPRAPDRADVLVVGSGAGGAPLAYELCRKGLKVVLVEKGEIVSPLRSAEALEKYYVGQGFTVSRSGDATMVLAGSTVGGSTSVNSGTCMRPLPHCLQRWDELTGMNFSGEALNPYFERVEKHIGVCTPGWELQSKSAFLVKEGFEKIGRPEVFLLPRNAPACKGSGRCAFVCPTQAKKSTDTTYLPQALEHGLHLIIKTTVTGITEEKDGVKVGMQGAEGRQAVRCKKLIIAAGALYTPLLIKRNRLGSHYREAGKNLKIHPASKVFGWFPHLDHGAGGIPQGVGYCPPDLPHITMEGIHTPAGVTGPIISVGGKNFNWWMEHHNELASFGLMVRDRGTGKVISTPDFPSLDYRVHPQDAMDAVKGLKIIGEAFFAAGAQRLLLPFYGNNPSEINSLAELQAIRPEKIRPRDITFSGFHPQGTAGIGRLVDEHLLLKGTKNIYICDASVFPDSPGVNPMVTIMVLSMRLGDYLGDSFFH
ncbi:MAG TPA: GMC family oxidoreductase [Chitinophagales bacterium]|nr:GMC family oxidoreductase [Chitinophagales bacterium]